MGKERTAKIDFEARSVCDLKKSGPWVYSKHPTTEALCMSYKLPGKKTKLWHMAHPAVGIEESPPPKDLFDWIENGGLVEAHNAFMEKSMWYNQMMPKYRWPHIKTHQWRCSAARAAACSLPRALEKLADALDLGMKKDMDGHKTMMKCCRPRKPLKREREDFYLIHEKDAEMPVLWNEKPEDLEKMWKYCINDVDVEAAASDYMPDLSPLELKVWKMDQAINQRGIWCDREMAETALVLIDKAKKELNGELKKITGIPRATLRAQIKSWLSEHEEIDLPDTTGDTLDIYLEPDSGISRRARRVLHIVRTVNKSSTAKYKAMLLRISEDNRIRDTLKYHGTHTGRWSSQGVQLQNLVRGGIKDMEWACNLIKEKDYELAQLIWGDTMELLSFAVRGAFGAPEGFDIIAADFAAIEARVVFWLAEAHSALKIFERGEDIYCDMASTIYRMKINKDEHPNERQMGKQSILGLGFGMGFVKFLATLWKYKIKLSKEDIKRIVPAQDYRRIGEWIATKGKSQTSRSKDVDPKQHMPELILTKYIVDLYRNRFPEIPALWRRQENAAIKAVEYKGKVITAGRVKWRYRDDFLVCKLPSGRKLYYFKPKLSQKKSPWGMKTTLSYMGQDSETKRWVRVFTYGGKLVENIVQAIARDLMAWAMLRIEETDTYKLILSVHDEIIAQVKEGEGCLKEFEELMVKVPKWGEGCPVGAEGWRGKRYKK